MYIPIIEAFEAGPVALQRLAVIALNNADANGTVISVSPHACYLEFDGQLLLLACTTLGAGPMSIRVDTTFASLRVGQSAILSQDLLRIGDEMIINCKGLSESNGCHVLHYRDLGVFRQGECLCPNADVTHRLMVKAAGKSIIGSIVNTLVTAPESIQTNSEKSIGCGSALTAATHRYFSREVMLLHRWLLNACRTEKQIPAPLGLLGAGGGLTPAGDDCLAGVVLMLQMTGYNAVARRLIHDITPHFDERTHPLSAELLRLCGEGYAGEALLSVIAKWSQTGYTSQTVGEIGRRTHQSTGYSGAPRSDSLRDYVTKQHLTPFFTDSDAAFSEFGAIIDAMGHSSGWDTFAGAVLVSHAINQHAEPAAGKPHHRNTDAVDSLGIEALPC